MRIKIPYLKKYGICINKEVMKHPELRHGVCRYNQMHEMVHNLCHKKYNPLIMADDGVGKLDLIKALADRINVKDVPVQLQNTRIWIIDWNKHMLTFKVFKNIINECLKYDKDYQYNILLAVDEQMGMRNTGCQSRHQEQLMANLLDKELMHHKIQCIMTMTSDDYYDYLDNSPVGDVLDLIYLTMPDAKQMAIILQNNLIALMNHYHISMEPKMFKDILVITGHIDLDDKKMIYNPDKVFKLVNKVFSNAQKHHHSVCEFSDIKDYVHKHLSPKMRK